MFINMKNTETKKIVGGGYASPEMKIVTTRLEMGFCQSLNGQGSTDDLYEVEGAFQWK